MVGEARFAGEERRLHPATLMLAVTKLGPQSINMLPALAGIGVTGNWGWIAPAIVIFITISLVTSLASWLRFSWRVDEDDIAITSGVLSRNSRTIPFDRIQDVNIEQGLIARMLGLAKVTLETGGGGETSDEGSLNAIALEDAAALRDHIRAHRTAAVAAQPVGADTVAGGANPSEIGRELFAMSPARLFIAGLFNFSLAIMAVLFGLLNTFDDLLPFDLFSTRFWIEQMTGLGLDAWIMDHRWLTAVAGLLALLVVGMATGLIRMVMANWGFRLERTERGFRRTRGLTTRTDVVIPAARVQGAVVESGLIGRRFGWHSLALQSLAGDGKDEADHVVAPFATLAEIDAILAEVGLDRAALEERPRARDGRWQGVHWVEALGGLVMASFLAIIAAINLPAIITNLSGGDIAIPPWIPIAILAATALLLIVSWLDWRNQRWSFDGRLLHISSGAISRRHYVLPARNVQSADLAVGPITRRFKVATLSLGVPGGKAGQHRIAAMAQPLARVLRAQLLTAR